MRSIIYIKRIIAVLAIVMSCISVRGDVWLGAEPADIDMGASQIGFGGQILRCAQDDMVKCQF